MTAETLELSAPAKVNLTLEVLGRRDDGYHEVASIVQTIDLADRLRLESGPALALRVEGPRPRGVPDGTANLVYRAAEALRAAAGRPSLGARIVLEKHVPAGAGLGGGSSDAAAALRGLRRLWDLLLADSALVAIAAGLGSDVPFFLEGGAALLTGRGDAVEPLPGPPSRALTLFLPPAEVREKTRRMYALVSAADFSDGSLTHAAAARLRAGEALREGDRRNVFERHVATLFPAAAAAMAACRDAGVSVFLSGAGPAFLSLTPRQALPDGLLETLRCRWQVAALAVRTLGRDAGT